MKLLQAVRAWFSRARAWASPVDGWKSRVRDYRAGVVTWEVEGHPNLPPFMPWPPQWCSWTIDGTDTVSFISHTSIVSGRTCEGADAVRCARCGVPVHMEEAGMADSLSVPACPWCVGAVERTR